MAKLTFEEMSKIGKSNVVKSKTHERRIANLFTDWSGVPFRRRRVEGRESTVVERESTADIIPVKGDIIFSIEAKSGIIPHIDGLMANPINNVFTKHWHQSNYDASIMTNIFKRKVYPFLIMKPHSNFDWVVIAQEAFKLGLLKSKSDPSETHTAPWFPSMGFDYYDRCGEITHNVSHTRKKKNEVLVPLKLAACYICRWRDFAAQVSPASIFTSGVLPTIDATLESESQDTVV